MGQSNAKKKQAVRSRSGCMTEPLESRRLLSTITLNPNATHQIIQGWGTAGVYPTNLVTVAQAGAIMRDAGMNVVRVTPSASDYAYTVGGNMRTPVPISANLDDNVARFNPAGNNQSDLLKWLETNGLEPERTKMIGSLWSPPHWMKITTGRLMEWDGQSAYDPIIPWGDYGGNTGAGRVNPTMWTDWARYVLSTVKYWQQETGLPMYAFSFQNEPNVPTTYSSATFTDIANDVNDPSAGYTSGHWDLYGDGVQALATELTSHPEITTKFFGPELSQLGGGVSNPYNLPSYNAVRQNLISRGLLNVLGGWATHQYTYPADDAPMWDAWYNGSAHAANIVSGGTSNVLGWVWPTPGIASDNKEIWQTETDGEDQTWTKDGAMGFGLKIYNALVYGNVSGYTSWTLTGYSATDPWGVVQLNDINNPTNSFKFDAFKQFSRWIRPGAQRIDATFANGKATTGGANELDSYNGLNVAAFNHATDKRLTMVLVNMQSTSDATTITIPAGFNVNSFQVYQTAGTQKYVQLSDLVPVNGQITLTVPALSMVTITGNYDTPSLPAPWVSNDIGVPSPSGSGGYNSVNGIFTLAGGGTDIWDTSDQFQYVSQSAGGNGSIIARVTAVQNTNVWAKAGVMFRDSTAASAMYADVVVTPSSGVNFQWRNSTGGASGFVQTTGITAPAWVKLVRSGNSFTAFYATTTATPATSDWIQIGSAQTIPMSITARAGLAVTSHSSGTLATATFSGVQLTLTNQAPTVATAAAASPGTVTGTSTNLSVLGADDNGESGLKYSWSATGAAPVSFTANDTNAAKATTALFIMAGTYTLVATLSDGLVTTTSTVVVIVQPALRSLSVSPAVVQLRAGQTQAFAATAYDQFGEIMATPSITWSMSGVGTVSAAGMYTAALAGSASVSATSGTVSASGSVVVTSAAPTVASAASAGQTTVTGNATTLSVLGADDGGEAALVYTWSVVSGPSAVNFAANGTNSSKNTSVLFSQAGAYVLRATITDASGNTATSDVAITVQQTATSLKITPGTASVGTSSSRQYAAVVTDQFGRTISSPSVTWSVASGGGTINSSGLFTAPLNAGKSTIRAVLGSLSATATATIFTWSPYSMTARKVTSNTAAVSFKDSTTIETGFQVQVGQRQSNGSIAWITTYVLGPAAGSSSTINFSIPGTLTAGTWYFRSRAANGSAYSNWSNTASLTF